MAEADKRIALGFKVAALLLELELCDREIGELRCRCVRRRNLRRVARQFTRIGTIHKVDSLLRNGHRSDASVDVVAADRLRELDAVRVRARAVPLVEHRKLVDVVARRHCALSRRRIRRRIRAVRHARERDLLRAVPGRYAHKRPCTSQWSRVLHHLHVTGRIERIRAFSRPFRRRCHGRGGGSSRNRGGARKSCTDFHDSSFPLLGVIPQVNKTSSSRRTGCSA